MTVSRMRIHRGTGRTGLVAVLALLLALMPRWSSQPAAQSSGNIVDVAIVLAVDCSWSVNESEFDQQMKGLALALRSQDVVDAIRAGPRGRIAVALLQWSAPDSQNLTLDWLIIETPADALLVAGRIEAAPRRVADGATSITAAIATATELHRARPFAADRQVIDVSSDGLNNVGGLPEAARDRAIAGGITINSLAILNEVDYLHFYFRNHIIGGDNAFVEVAADYSDYHRAIKRKLLREIGLPIS